MKILSDLNRLRILCLLKQKPLCVCELAYVLQVTQPSVSRHLRKLKANGLVNQKQAGFWTDYFLVPLSNASGELVKDILKLFSQEKMAQEDNMRLRQANRKKLCC